jgi:hypothetical protein
MIVWFDLVVGAGCLASALLLWVRQRRRDRVVARWSSLTCIALGLCAWFAAAAKVSGLRTAGIWYLLVSSTAVLHVAAIAACSLVYSQR